MQLLLKLKRHATELTECLLIITLYTCSLMSCIQCTPPQQDHPLPSFTMKIGYIIVMSKYMDSLEVFTWRYSLGGIHLEVFTWKYSPGGSHLEVFTWWYSLGGIHLEVFTWRYSLGGIHLEVFTWRYSLGGIHLEVFTWRYSLGGIHLEVFPRR